MPPSDALLELLISLASGLGFLAYYLRWITHTRAHLANGGYLTQRNATPQRARPNASNPKNNGQDAGQRIEALEFAMRIMQSTTEKRIDALETTWAQRLTAMEQRQDTQQNDFKQYMADFNEVRINLGYIRGKLDGQAT